MEKMQIPLHYSKKDTSKKGSPKDIKFICMDMSVLFQAGAKKQFPKAKIIFDKFHVIKVLNKQLDKVRNRENKHYHEILIEGINSKPRGFAKRAFGFKRSKNLKITIFIALGKLDLTPT